jgi:hypothetical protein
MIASTNDEARYTIVGRVDRFLIYFAYPARNERIRIIMARKATKDEQDDDFRQTSRSVTAGCAVVVDVILDGLGVDR